MHTQNIYAARLGGKYHVLKLPPSAELAYRGTQVLLIGGFGACCQENICGEIEYQIVNQKLIGLARGGSRIQEYFSKTYAQAKVFLVQIARIYSNYQNFS